VSVSCADAAPELSSPPRLGVERGVRGSDSGGSRRGTCVLVIGLVWVSDASAIIRHVATGATVSYQPLRGAARPFDVAFSNLEYSAARSCRQHELHVLLEPFGPVGVPTEYTSGSIST